MFHEAILSRLILLISLGAAGGAIAAELKGVQMSDALEAGGKSLVLNGLGVRQATIFKVNVYVAGLYLPARSSDPAAVLASADPKIVEMEFVRDVDAKTIKEVWKDGYDKNCAERCSELQSRLEEFSQWLAGFKKGDRARYVFLPNRMEYSMNGQLKGHIDGPEFGRVVLATWLGPKPPNASLKEGLLGLGK